MKKVITVLFLAWIAVHAYGEVTIDGIRYDLNSTDMTATVKGSSLDTVVIPGSVVYETQNYAVTSIGEEAFWGNSNLKSVTIPGSVTNIGDGAFIYCGSLASVTLGDGVDSIGNNAFESCPLTSITIPGSVTNIGNEAFRSTALTSITIPGSVANIGDGAFIYCGNLASVTLGDGVASIGNEAFKSCPLTSITIPGSVTKIGNEAFRATALTSITIPGSVTKIGNGAFMYCGSLASVTLNNGVGSIGNEAFKSCPLTSITIPGSVTKIGDEAFRSCGSLTTLTINDGVDSIGTNAFGGCPLSLLTYEAKNCFGGSFDMTDSATIVFGDSVMNLENVRFDVNGTNNIYCQDVLTPVFSSSTFSSYESTLHVPFASIETYMATEWRHFYIKKNGILHDIAVNSNDSTKGVIYGGGTYWETETATIIAAAKEGYDFKGWSDGDISNPRLVTVSQDSSFTAIFADRTADTLILRDTIMVSDTLIIYQTDTIYLYQTDTIYLEYDSTAADQYTLEDYGVYYFMGTVVNRDNIYIKLYSADGKLLKKGDDDLEMGSYPDGIYIVTDGKGGFLKVIHTRL